ncbi:MAG: hypothetical protein V4505_12245 [Pseudomonadota bacterium]
MTPTAPLLVVLAVTVLGTDAWQVRRTLALVPGAGVLRCVPHLQDGRVRLDVLLPAGRVDEATDRVLACVVQGEIGAVRSWQEHLAAIAAAAHAPAQH